MPPSEPDPSPIDNLGSRIPEQGFTDSDEILNTFLEWIDDRGITLYAAQEEAILELFADSHVVLKTPTGSGKSLVAVALHFKLLAECERSFYTSPIKALVSEKFFDLCHIFGAENVGLMTGDGAVNRDAPILCCTAEILANMALREGHRLWATGVVMDEFHYYADRDRGMAWQLPLLILSRACFLLMSATLGDTEAIERDLEDRTGRAVAVVSSAKRPVPLDFHYVENLAHEAIDALVSKGNTPIYLVHFTQRAAAAQAQALMSINPCSKDEKKALKAALKGFRFDSPYGADLKRYLHHGIGLHHAGLLPRYRRMVEKLSQQGLLKVICGTDTLGVGINVPIRTVLFTQLCKFDGEKMIVLSVRDFQQIAGRAGRAGFDAQGTVVCLAPAHVVENKRLAIKIQTGQRKRRKVVRQKPPTRGYKHFDKATFEGLVSRRPEALEPVFDVSYGLLLDLIEREPVEGEPRGYAAVLDLIARSHVSERRREKLREKTRDLLEDLIRAEVVRRVPGAADDDLDALECPEELQQNFSLFHSLSLFLLHAIDKLDPEAEHHHLQMVSLTEAILDSPRAVLQAQAHRIRGELIAEMKAQGVEYDERMERVKEISWERPMAEWIYQVFNDYTPTHPWVEAEHIRPKTVVRDMVERFASFTDYVKDFRLQRCEGVLLRYLTMAYKTLVQTIPVGDRTEAFEEVLAFLCTTLERVDSSLLTEWEHIRDKAIETVGDAAPPPIDISADQRSFRTRVRTELHLLVRALSQQDYTEAAASIRSDPDHAWTADEIEDAIGPFIDEFGPVVFDGRARQAYHTHLEKTGGHQWRVSQALIDEDGEPAWFIDGTVDLRSDTNPHGPLIALIRMGDGI